MNKIVKYVLLFFAFIVIACVLVVAVMLIKQIITDNKINDDVSWIYTDDKFKTPVSVNEIGVIKQEISCGYACIELLARWQGKDITEKALLTQNDDRITTATGNGFAEEMNKQFPEFNTTKHSNLTNSELIEMVYKSLEKNIPVPLGFAAIYNDIEKSTWTLHYAIITAMDITKNEITVSNPYGYIETYSVDEFLQATRYDSYKNMEIYFKLGFAFGVFEKNTIYIIERE